MGTEGESGEHETDILVTGSESDCDVRGHNERRNDGTEKKKNDGSTRKSGRESSIDDDRSRHVGYSVSGNDSEVKGNETCKLCDGKNSRDRKKT